MSIESEDRSEVLDVAWTLFEEGNKEDADAITVVASSAGMRANKVLVKLNLLPLQVNHPASPDKERIKQFKESRGAFNDYLIKSGLV